MMKYNKFIFLYTSNFCARVNDFFCIDEWIEHGYDVEYWDLSAFTCHEHLEEFRVKGLIIRRVLNLEAFRQLVEDYKQHKTLYLTWVNYCWYSAGFYNILSRFKCDYAFFDNSIIPVFNTSRNGNRYDLKKLKRAVVNRYYSFIKKTPLFKPARYYFQLSENYLGIDKKDSNTKHGWCNSGDYERSKRLRGVMGREYIVFLDQYIPYHNDNILNGYKQVEANRYYTSLNKCFSIIEDRYRLPVVIAAHPAAILYKENNPFEGREIIFNRTAELVNDCKYVLAHYTTAVSYVVLNYKGMLLLTSDAIREVRPVIYEHIIHLSELLGIRCVNQDIATVNDLYFDDINMEKYNYYKYNFLTNSHSEPFSNYENIISLIKE